MRLVTPVEMAQIDRKVQKKFFIPSIVLMENAARGLVDILEDYFELEGLKTLVVCGTGNNGGDGLAAARHLTIRGADVEAILIDNVNKLKGDALKNAKIIGAKTTKNLKKLISKFQPEVIIDAIFGTGFRGKPSGIYKKAIDIINESECFIASVDIPSGIDGETGAVNGNAVFADLTVTMCLPKTGLVFYPGKYFCGDLWINDIGITDAMIGIGKNNLIDDEEVASIIPARPSDGHKGTFGNALVIAGSRGFSGAACLTAEAALRTGTGLVTIGVPDSLIDVVETKLTEVVKFPLPQTKSGTISRSAISLAIEKTKDSQVMIIGPGISTNRETKEFLFRLIRQVRIPIIIDADGINNIAQNPQILKKTRVDVVLTPHPGELARLIKVKASNINRNRIEIARMTAKKYKVVLVIKGAPTVIANPEGEVWVNATGNSGLASGGSGDVLSGMIGGLVAQGVDPFNASKAAVYLHGLAADLALDEQNEYSLIAGDLLKYIGPAITEIIQEYP